MDESAESTAVPPDGERYRVMVALANPAHERDLVELASAIANQRDGVVDAIHVVTVPDQTALGQAARHVDQLDAQAAELLERAAADAETFGVEVESHTILSHSGFRHIFDAARTHDADVVVMGWGEHCHARAEPRSEELAGQLPCDFLVFRDRGFDPERILVPTAGGPDSDLSAEVATMLRSEYGSEVSVLHVTDDVTDGESFLREWTARHDLEDATHLVSSEAVRTAIEHASRDATMVVLGATERGVLARLIRGSPVEDVADELDCSVVLAERPTRRSLLERLFKSRERGP